MKLNVIGSGSSGNCYILTSNTGRRLIIEAGLKIADIKKALGWQLGSVDGCVVSHRHNDHALAVPDLLKCGVRVLAPWDVLSKEGSFGNRFAKVAEESHGYKVGEYRVFTFPLQHDVPCFGYLISHEEMGTLLFVTDTFMVSNQFVNVNHVLVECNYTDEQLERSIESGATPAAMRDRLLLSHMELQTTKKVIQTTNLALVKDIVLIHLSNNNSEAERMRKEVMGVSGKPTYIAEAGLELELTR